MNQSNNNIYDDPKLTAYALGELDAIEAAEIGTLIAGDDEARRIVDEIRRTAKQLESEFADEPKLSLSDSQREVVKLSAKQLPIVETRSSFLTSRRFWMSTGLAAAACLVLSLSLPMFWENKTAEWFARDMLVAKSDMEELKQSSAQKTREALNSYAMSVEARAYDLNGDRHIGLWSVDSPTNHIEQAQQNTLQVAPSLEDSYSNFVTKMGSGVGNTAPSNGIPLSLNSSQSIPEPPRSADGSGGGIAGRRKRTPPQIAGWGRDKSQHFYTGSGDMYNAATFGNGDFSREAYARIVDNKFMRVGEQPLSTFSIDVDTASYANMRRFTCLLLKVIWKS